MPQQHVTFTVEKLVPERQKVVLVHREVRIEKRWTELGVADQILALRPGAKFRAQVRVRNGIESYSAFTLVELAEDVALGTSASARPDTDRNPYGFLAWMATKPFQGEKRDPTLLHEREDHNEREDHSSLRSGKLKITLEAVSPIFIPGSAERAVDAGEHRLFFKCWNAEKRASLLALPGSSLKGAVRALFEGLTNSRAGVSDHDVLAQSHLFRRRASQLFVVITPPTDTTDGEVEECRFCFTNVKGQRVTPPRLPEAVELKDPNAKGVQRVEWRANLFAVPTAAYNHGDKCKIAYQRTGQKLKICRDDYKRWKKMASHPHFIEWHRENVANNDRARGLYNNTPPDFANYSQQLFSISKETLLFGMATGGYLRPFGKNVNFLWPSPSPAEAASDFLARSEDAATIENSDPAEITFGYIARGPDSNCLRGRVRFGTFWLDDSSPVLEPGEVVDLLPLTAPANARAKSRTLYWEPDDSGQAPDPGTKAPDPGTKAPGLRGRKLYWHQKAHPDAETKGLPRQHTYSSRRTDGPDTPTNNPPLRIRPLPAGATFTGEIHFSNLTPAELGALLASIHPGLLFGSTPQEQSRHGIKLGKGKPRGLGSLRVTSLQLFKLRPPVERFAGPDLAASRGDGESSNDSIWASNPAGIEASIAQYKKWVVSSRAKSGIKAGDFDRISAIRDLRALTRIPDRPSVRIYPTRFDQYAWPAGWCNPEGGPSDVAPGPVIPKPRPNAMKRSRDGDTS